MRGRLLGGLSRFSALVRANVYVDGFNLYYGALKGTPNKWLDITALCRLLLPGDAINRVRYFTARIQPDPRDPDKPTRQQLYLRALATIPNLSIHFGHYLSSRPRMPLANPQPGQPRTVEVIKTEEKGSDVNLATYLLLDAFDADYELAVVISNDSDLLLPIAAVRGRFGLTVGVLNPTKWGSSHERRRLRSMRQVMALSGLQSCVQRSPGNSKLSRGVLGRIVTLWPCSSGAPHSP